MEVKNIYAVSRYDSVYPTRLKEIADPPTTLYVRGTLPQDDVPVIAIVGTRKATHEGRARARTLARELGNRGAVIVSGLALGVDAAAHEGALDAEGITVAVLGCGADTIYPSSHESLGRRIEVRGAIISEYPAGTPAYPNQFLARNRIISGLADAVIIVEAPIASGALATARHAANQGREVFVMPGPADHPHYEGSHMLIREGARLIRNAKDLLEDLPAVAEALASKSARAERLTEPRAVSNPVFAALITAREPLSVDKIAALTTLEPNIVLTHLTMLTLEGTITEENGKFRIH
ncbi:MAG: DNA-protecting protein DprA [Candidatus Brennerbacteria bacterium]|nr:DNA-protecting protein DprA [Candidatus Brennerbacteria bacterium]